MMLVFIFVFISDRDQNIFNTFGYFFENFFHYRVVWLQYFVYQTFVYFLQYILNRCVFGEIFVMHTVIGTVISASSPLFFFWKILIGLRCLNGVEWDSYDS